MLATDSRVTFRRQEQHNDTNLEIRPFILIPIPHLPIHGSNWMTMIVAWNFFPRSNKNLELLLLVDLEEAVRTLAHNVTGLQQFQLGDAAVVKVPPKLTAEFEAEIISVVPTKS